MKKYITLLSLLSVIGACNNSSKGVIVTGLAKDSFIYKPRYVHNICTGVWAVETGKLVYGPISKSDSFQITPLYFGLDTRSRMYSGMGERSYENTPPDSAVTDRIGHEFQFDSKEAAISAFTKWTGNPDSTKRRSFLQDSIFKCNHTYN